MFEKIAVDRTINIFDKVVKMYSSILIHRVVI